ncbi:hypothetical protein VTK73DRAFT_5090 [Phialemonium thermophilum]|uniref:Secreted protein n=1 Tax=Phialemonium thermophilum TaxID=223376 RepID=A0ABR3V3Z0_9PEZI
MMVCGWILRSTSFSASRSSSAASTATDVVPSPTSSSCTLEMLTSTLAAALSSAMALRIVAPSLVTMISPVDLHEMHCRILSIPLGPSVLFTRSPTAMAPTKAARRAFSPFSSVVPSSKICVGLNEDCTHGRAGVRQPRGNQKSAAYGRLLPFCSFANVKLASDPSRGWRS